MAEGYSNKTNFSWDNQRRFDSANQPSISSYTMRRGSRNRNGSHSDSNRPQRAVCRFFRRGACQYGERCRFAHTEPSAALNTEAASTSSTGSASPAKLDDPATGSPHTFNDKWVEAPEFVPSASKSAKTKSYADALSPPDTQSDDDDTQDPDLKLCPYAELHGVCSYPEGECLYTHGEICEYCGNAALHPKNERKRNEHTASCVQQHQRNMELSFAVARSKDKSCGVCFEVVMEKSSREQRFGILPNCNHVFCLSCIRKWRQAKQFDNKIIRACPECRVSSDFVCPSMFWVDTKEEKEKLIKDYKVALALKNCKYFKQGRGKCPFGNKCFYLHALPDGTKTDVGPPPRQPRRQNHDGDMDMLQGGACDRQLRVLMISAMVQFFDGYPDETSPFIFGDQLIIVEVTELSETDIVVLDEEDFSAEILLGDSGVDVTNGYLFSFIRQIEVTSLIAPEFYAADLFDQLDEDNSTASDENSDSDESYFEADGDSDGMGESIFGLLEPIDDQFYYTRAERRQRREANWAIESRRATLAGLPTTDHSTRFYRSCHACLDDQNFIITEQARLVPRRDVTEDLVPLSSISSAAEHFLVLLYTICAFFNPDPLAVVPYWAFDDLLIDYARIPAETDTTELSSASNTLAVHQRQELYVDVTRNVRDDLSISDNHTGQNNNTSKGDQHLHKRITELRATEASGSVSGNYDSVNAYTIEEPIDEVNGAQHEISIMEINGDDVEFEVEDLTMVDLDDENQSYIDLPDESIDYMERRSRRRFRYVFRLA